MDIFSDIVSPIQALDDNVTRQGNVSLFLQREDLNHPEIMGNKLRKLKYNIIEARKLDMPVLLSFGGAYSNHILALSAAGKIFSIPTIGVIRGEELKNKTLNPVLARARANGMHLHFISRELYKVKNELEFINQLEDELGPFFLIPEGGSNELGVKGAAEMLQGLGAQYDVIVCACGTGGTLSGLIKGVYDNKLQTHVIGLSVLKDNSCRPEDIASMLPETMSRQVKWEINTDYHFGGYAKKDCNLLCFMQGFKRRHGVDLDTIYTGKMMYGLYQLIQSGTFSEGCRILAIHTGGTQTAGLG